MMRVDRKARYLVSGGSARYLAGRLLTGVGTLLVVTVLVFAAVHLVPGSYAQILLGPYATPEARAQIQAKYGLNEPLPVQYIKWLGHVASGNFGASLNTGAPVSDVLIRRVPVTVELALLSVALAILIGIPLALLAGLAHKRSSRTWSRLGGAAAMSTPDFVIGSLFLYLFSRYALGLPVGKYVPFVDNPAESIRGMLLPALTLSVFGVALIVRTGRDSVASVMSEPHVTAALARGESTRHIVRHHVVRNASIPVLTALSVYAGYLMGGAVIVENLFSLPGLGQGALFAIQQRDYAVVEGIVLIAAATFIAINMLTDFAYGVIDPRIGRAKAR